LFKLSILLSLVLLTQNTFLQSSSILEKIAFGSAYFLTSNQSNFQNIGNKNIVATITINQKKAYLIVLIAGLILSSFHHESITNTHPRRINNTVVTDANKISIEIAKSRNSPKFIVFQKIDEDALSA
jgi:hypothetical protein